MTNSAEWCWLDRQGVQRVVDGAELRGAIVDGRVPPDVPVWQHGMTTFLPAAKVQFFAEACLEAQTNETPLDTQGGPPGKVQTPSREAYSALQRTLKDAKKKRRVRKKLPEPNVVVDNGWDQALSSKRGPKTKRSADPKVGRPHPPPPPTPAKTSVGPVGPPPRKPKPPSVAPPLPSAPLPDAPPPPLTDGQLGLTPPPPPVEPKDLPPLGPPPKTNLRGTMMGMPPYKPELESGSPQPEPVGDKASPNGGTAGKRTLVGTGSAPPPIVVPTPDSQHPAAITCPPPFHPDAPLEDVKVPAAPKAPLFGIVGEAPADPPPDMVPDSSKEPFGDPFAEPLSSPGGLKTTPPSAAREDPTPAPPLKRFLQKLTGDPRMLAAVAGSSFVLVVLAGVIWAATRDGEPTPPKPTASGRVPAALPTTSVASSAGTPPPAPTSAAPCVLGEVRGKLAVGVAKSVPIELWGDPSADLIGLGFASRGPRAAGLAINPTNLKPSQPYGKDAAGVLRRVVPYRSGGQLRFAVDSQDPDDETGGAPLTLPTDPPVQLRVRDNSLVVEKKDSEPEVLAKLPEDMTVQAMRAAVFSPNRAAVVFRMDNAIWLAWLDETHRRSGELVRVPGTGTRVGSPSVGWNGREALLAFANRENEDAAWTIRTARAGFGVGPESSTDWSVPEGGPGGAAIAPSVMGLEDGRWLVVWTEGKSGERAVRAQTYGADLSSLGEPFGVSGENENAGQGIAAVGAKGRGVIIYLSIVGKLYQVRGATINCP